MTRYALVALLNGHREPFTYAIPEQWAAHVLRGTFVTVPLQNRLEKGVVIEVFDRLPQHATFKVKPLKSCEAFPNDVHYHVCVEKIARYYRLNPMVLYQRLRTFLSAPPRETAVETPDLEHKAPETHVLTDEQQHAVDELSRALDAPAFYPAVLHGVTGSGKTEVYKSLLCAAHRRGQSALLLLPDVGLAVRFMQLLRAELPSEILLFGFHSASSALERRMLWKALCSHVPVVVIGVHLPVLLPIRQLGLIIVDEEHEVGYQEKKHPRLNTRECALLRAEQCQIPILLGSATPSLSSLYNVRHRGWKLFSLTRRFSGTFPEIRVVSLLDAPRRGSRWLSRELTDAIADRLERKEQAILFLNRRGYSFFIQCRSCGFVFGCPSCSVSLTFHVDKTMRCHYCGYQEPEPASCRQCKSHDDLLKKGVGTQQLVEQVQKLFPNARIARADLDATVHKKRWSETVRRFYQREIDILVGTQTITRGYHFPGVTLVGLIWADVNLSIPLYNAAETTLQQIVQVAGRAGRASHNGLVVVQTMTPHPLFEYVNEVDYVRFFEYEMAFRERLGYPPIARFAELELRNESESFVDLDAQSCFARLRAFVLETHAALTILGPSKPAVEKVQGVHMRKLYLKSPSYAVIEAACEGLGACEHGSRLFFTPQPVQ